MTAKQISALRDMAVLNAAISSNLHIRSFYFDSERKTKLMLDSAEIER
jgi:IS1 family transposase